MRKGKVIQYRFVYWRDIPVNVHLRQGRQRHVYPLPDHFQKTVYRAAYRARAITGDAYMTSWHSGQWLPFKGDGDGDLDLETAGAQIAAEVIRAYDEERLNALALNEGHEPEEGS